MNIIYRRMKYNDLGQVIRLERVLFSDPWSLESFLEELRENEIAHSFVFELDKKIIGYAVCWYYFEELHIGNFAIHPDFQGKGLGTILFERIFNTFNDYKVAYLEVRKNNLAAIKLYNKFGFKETYSRKGYYSNGEDAIVMVKHRE